MEGKVGFDSRFQRLQSVAGCPVSFGPLGRQYVMVGTA
jgi:hypothetical protein